MWRCTQNDYDKLNSKNASSRNIWTPEIDASLNNFTTSNRDALKSRLFPSQSPTDTEVENLINKISYRARYRGTKEMDIFVSSFVKSIVTELNFDELKDLNSIINLNDEEIISKQRVSISS
mgnify:CR=1 FL=1